MGRNRSRADTFPPHRTTRLRSPVSSPTARTFTPWHDSPYNSVWNLQQITRSSLLCPKFTLDPASYKYNSCWGPASTTVDPARTFTPFEMTTHRCLEFDVIFINTVSWSKRFTLLPLLSTTRPQKSRPFTPCGCRGWRRSLKLVSAAGLSQVWPSLLACT